MTHTISKYYDPHKTAEVIQDGRHRDWVGGLWEEVGRMQLDFLVQHGLRPDMRFLDVGCGCFRAGVHLVAHQNPGCYYGIDISQELLDVGYDQEIAPAGLGDRLPRENLLCDGGFNAGRFGVVFDMGIAQSVFTHLPFNHVRLCLARLTPAFAPGGRFYATAFISPDDHDWTQPLLQVPGNITTQPVDDPYHYRVADFEYAAAGLPWRVDHLGDWSHPRNQKMLRFTRTG